MKHFPNPLRIAAGLILVTGIFVISACNDDQATVDLERSVGEIERSIGQIETQMQSLQDEIRTLTTLLQDQQSQNEEFDDALDTVTSGIIRMLMERTSLPVRRAPPELLTEAVKGLRDQMKDATKRVKALEKMAK